VIKEIQITATPELLGYPYTVLREIEGQGFEVEVDYPDPVIEDSKTYKLLKKIADKVGVEDE